MAHKDYSQTNPRPQFYACHLAELRQIAIDHGYTLAIHGSMLRDLDLIAVAWIDKPKPHAEMIDKMLESIGGIMTDAHLPKPNEKPHGRLVYTLLIWGNWFLDISVIPPNNTQKENK